MNLVTLGLPAALGVIMLGIGLTLTPADFRRIGRHPKAVGVALVVQLVLLPLVCFGLVHLFRLASVLAVGMMLLAACPGGPKANVLSHIFGGDVALSISLTAVNSVIAAFTLPVSYNFAAHAFTPGAAGLGLQFGKVLEVFAEALVPVVVGMAVRRLRPAAARAVVRPVRIGSVVLLVAVILAAVVQNLDLLSKHVSDLAGVTLTFGLISLASGFAIPRAFGFTHAQAVSAAFEIGVHNAVVAIVIAQTVIGSPEMALPAGIYTLIMQPLAVAFGFLLRAAARRSKAAATPAPSPAARA
ncbi:bile acid:sodium symporter family protein [Streptomyces inhibens]|uniref:Bile acid:sodium symporter family protein n=1 Tax=Streptomyces inhibens TaxID=2293571 RepID=A0A371Q7R2_STRIH|nr:bile acid:sodium symporter [Streptomyces inhibens]REK90453.1 bile acid:sodium symporter family protein [Streptomyces inhibens]